MGNTTKILGAEINALNAATASYFAGTVTSASYATTASYVQTAQTASYVLNAVSSSFTSTASYVNPLNQNVSINGNLNVVGTASFTYSTASIVQVGAATITLNTDYPATRFGGINVIDSGSFGNSSTGSLLWDSLNNRWIYSNPSGSSYDGGMLISGPRNISGLGSEVGTTTNAILKGQGGDHLTSSAMFEVSGSVGIGTSTPSYSLDVQGTGRFTNDLQVTGSLSVTGSQVITGSLKIKNGAIPVLDTVAGNLYDVYGNTSVNFSSNQLLNYWGVNVVNWGSNYLMSNNSTSAATMSIDWENRYLADTTATQRLKWATSVIQVTGSLSVTGSQVITGSLRGQVSALSIASNTASVDMSSNNFFILNLVNGANTHINPTNINPGQTVNIRVNQGSAGTGTVSFPSTVDQPSGSAYTGTQVANAIDIVTMITFDSSLVFVSSVRNMI